MKIITTRTFDSLFWTVKHQDSTQSFLEDQPFQRKSVPSLIYRIVFRFVEKDVAAFLFVGHHNEIYDYDFFK